VAYKPTGQEAGVQVVIDPEVWYKLKADLDAFDPKLTKTLRKRIRNAGDIAAGEVKKTLREPTPAGTSSGDGRDALIAATRVAVSFSKRSAGVKITTGSSRLDADHKGLLNVYNKKSFRHPVYGDKSVYVTQQGRPYFGASIMRVMNTDILDEIQAAVDDALTQIGRPVKSEGI